MLWFFFLLFYPWQKKFSVCFWFKVISFCFVGILYCYFSISFCFCLFIFILIKKTLVLFKNDPIKKVFFYFLCLKKKKKKLYSIGCKHPFFRFGVTLLQDLKSAIVGIKSVLPLFWFFFKAINSHHLPFRSLVIFSAFLVNFCSVVFWSHFSLVACYYSLRLFCQFHVCESLALKVLMLPNTIWNWNNPLMFSCSGNCSEKTAQYDL